VEKIRLENVTKVFGPKPAEALRLLDQGTSKDDIFNQTGHAVGLSNVSFSVEQGELLVVMGLSGSGKSTLIRCVNRLIEPTKGQIFVDGDDITRLSDDALLELRRRKFGMVFQHFALFPHRDIIGNVEYGLEIQGVPATERRERGREALKLVGLDGWEEAAPNQLSGGMQQRVGLARALAVKPDVLLMDEAFSALDPLIRRDMQHELIALQERVRKTIIFITHDLDEALEIGDRIVLMKDGAVVQIGTAEEILTNPADGYVERFVEGVDKTKILTAQAVMQPSRAVAYPGDGPRNVLRKMGEHGLSSMFVVNRDYQLQGVVRADSAGDAAKRGDTSIGPIIERDVATVPADEPLQNLFTPLADSPYALPVVADDGKLLGIVVKASVLEALAEGGSGS
jgi:glycine betaine/proline transport system ATP-binding protein